MRLAVAVDLGDDGHERVVDRAAAWVSRVGGTLDVVHVMRTGIAPVALGASDPVVRRVVAAELDQARRREAARLTELVSRVPAPHRGVARLLEGAPVDALVEAGDGYDGLFVATHGRSGLTHFWLGSVAEHVVRQARCTVIVLRMGAEG